VFGRHRAKTEANTPGRETRITNLRTAVANWSRVSSAVAPEQLIRLQAEYLDGPSRLIEESGGIIDRYDGEAIRAWFGFPGDEINHATRACQSSLSIREAGHQARFSTTVALTTGAAVVGNVGSPRHLTFSPVGHDVMLADRALDLALRLGASVVTADATKREAGAGFLWRFLGRFLFEGLSTPFAAFELLGMTPVLGHAEEMANQFEEALSELHAGRYARAGAGFERLVQQDSEDGPSVYYLEQCRRLQQEPPPDDWDGVFRM
jgi:adenylate cyclase